MHLFQTLKRYFLTGTISFTCIIALCSCTKTVPQGQGSVQLYLPNIQNTATATVNPHEITAELCIYLERVYADDLSNPAIWQTIQNFQADYPNITLTFESPVGGQNDYESREADITRLETEIIAGNGPDVFLFGYDDYTDCRLFPDLDKAMRNGAFLDSTALLRTHGVEVTSDDFWQIVMETGRVGEAQYFIPLSFDVDIAVGAKTTVADSVFDTITAPQNTTAFVTAVQQAYLKNHNHTTFFFDGITHNLATAIMDYDASTIRLSEPQVEEMFLLERELNHASYNQGTDDFSQEMTQTGSDQFFLQEAQRFANGERLFCVGNSSIAVPLLYSMSAQNTSATILTFPNEQGTGTAIVNSCVSINANTENALAATLFVSYLLSEESQNNAAYPSSLFTLPIRTESLDNALQSYWNAQDDLWWFHPTAEKIALWEKETGVTYVPATAEEIATHKLQNGAPLTPETLDDLYTICENCSVAYLETIFSKSIQEGMGENADRIIYATYDKFMNGAITYDEMADTLTQRLQLYLDE